MTRPASSPTIVLPTAKPKIQTTAATRNFPPPTIKEFKYPYQFSWKQEVTLLEVTKLKYGQGIISSKYDQLPGELSRIPMDDKYRLAIEVKASTLSFNIPYDVNMRYLCDSTGDIIPPENGIFALLDKQRGNQLATFVIPADEKMLIVQFPGFYLLATNLDADQPSVTKVISADDLPLTNLELKDKLKTH